MGIIGHVPVIAHMIIYCCRQRELGCIPMIASESLSAIDSVAHRDRASGFYFTKVGFNGNLRLF